MAALSIGYLLGSLNSSLIVARAYGVEIRTLGSKSAGLTNALRVLGKGAAVFVLVGDILKGVVACLIGLWIGVYVQAGDAVDCVSLLAAAAGAVIGHNWPVYFNFVGGKGALTAAAVMFMINWVTSLVSLCVFHIRCCGEAVCFTGNDFGMHFLRHNFPASSVRKHNLLSRNFVYAGAYNSHKAQGKRQEASVWEREQA